jgi:hypothetical protein
LEVRLNTFHEWTSSRLGGTRLCYVPAARLYDRDILAKSGGYREQHEHHKSQIRPSHVNLQSFERTLTGIILRSSEFGSATEPPFIYGEVPPVIQPHALTLKVLR